MAATRRRVDAWRPAELGRLVEQWNGGIATWIIATTFPGRSASAVHTLLNKLVKAGTIESRHGRCVRRTPRLDALFVRAVTGGIEVSALCDIFKRDMSSIYEWRRELGLTGVYPPALPATTPRRCLCGCGEMHDSEGPGDRIRPVCKSSDVWQSASSATLAGVRLHER